MLFIIHGMQHELSVLIFHYRYMTIFLLVLAQEIGIPTPIPNELVLAISGYLTLKGVLSLPLVLLIVASADFIGTNLLYFTFYLFGTYIIKHIPWFPISKKKITNITQRISKGGIWIIFLCRLTPFIRGYSSIIMGLLQIKPGTFLPIAIITAALWSAEYIIAGRILGSSFGYALQNTGSFKLVITLVIVGVVLFVVIQFFYKISKKWKTE